MLKEHLQWRLISDLFTTFTLYYLNRLFSHYGKFTELYELISIVLLLAN